MPAISLWMSSVRPKTLVAGSAPVLLGTALAVANGVVHWPSLPLLLICAVLIQVASNFINELEDFKRGADTKRVGPLRPVSVGLISATSMARASMIVVLVAFLLGLPLVAHAGWEVLVIGVVCLVMSWAYTGGPFPLAYNGLGDLFAFVFFGVTAVMGTYFVHSGMWSMEAFWLSVGSGLLAANILGVNNLRDIPTDNEAGKITLAVRIGASKARLLYVGNTMVAIVAPCVALQHRGIWMWLPLLALPYATLLCVLLYKREGSALNQVLGGTAFLYVQFTVFAMLGLFLAAIHSQP